MKVPKGRRVKNTNKQFNKNKQRWGCIAKKEACSIRVKTEKPKGQTKGSEIKKKTKQKKTAGVHEIPF